MGSGRTMAVQKVDNGGGFIIGGKIPLVCTAIQLVNPCELTVELPDNRPDLQVRDVGGTFPVTCSGFLGDDAAEINITHNATISGPNVFTLDYDATLKDITLVGNPLCAGVPLDDTDANTPRRLVQDWAD